MKKILVLLFVFVAFCTKAFANEYYVFNMKKVMEIQKQLTDIGFKILNANAIETRAVFIYANKKGVINAHCSHSNREIVFYRGMYLMMTSDDEIAAVLAHEISHSIDSYEGIFRGYFSFLNHRLTPKKYEYKADKRAIDFMVKAGYNPVASIIVMNKIMGQYRYDWLGTHPLTSRRMIAVYDYIYNKYPEYFVNNKYKNDPIYQNFLLNSRQNREKFKQKMQTQAAKSPHYL